MSNTQTTTLECTRCKTSLKNKWGVSITTSVFDEAQTIQEQVTLILCVKCGKMIMNPNEKLRSI